MRLWCAVVLAFAAAVTGCATTAATVRFEDAHDQRVVEINARYDARRRELEAEQGVPSDPFSPAAPGRARAELVRVLRVVGSPLGPLTRTLDELERARAAEIEASEHERDRAISADRAARRARVHSYAQRTTGRTDTW